jgi:polyisoprenoid-binding protein YceI
MRYSSYLFGFTLIASSLALGAQPSKRSVDLSSQNTSVEFLAIVKPGSLRINGTGAKVGGNISIVDKSLTGDLLVHLSELKTGIGLRDEHMKDKFLETSKYPDATLKITEMTLSQDPFVTPIKLSGVPFKGTLTVHGTENSIEGSADIDSMANDVNVEVKTKTTISNHKIEKPSYLGVKVDDVIELLAHLKLKK